MKCQIIQIYFMTNTSKLLSSAVIASQISAMAQSHSQENISNTEILKSVKAINIKNLEHDLLVALLTEVKNVVCTQINREKSVYHRNTLTVEHKQKQFQNITQILIFDQNKLTNALISILKQTLFQISAIMQTHALNCNTTLCLIHTEKPLIYLLFIYKFPSMLIAPP